MMNSLNALKIDECAARYVLLFFLWGGGGGGGDFYDPVDLRIYEQKISFFHHISTFLTIVWLLLHCFYPKTSFVDNL